jgi:hypothetical protein
MSAVRVSLFVLDTGPLITLAAADSLDYLLYPSVPVVIPDAVFYEATRDSAKLGAQSIIDWVKVHHAQVEIAVTNTYVNFDAARSVNPRAYEPNLGVRAAVEVIEEPGRLQDDAKAILLCEETTVMRRVVVRENHRTEHHGFSQAAGSRTAHPIGGCRFRSCARRRPHTVPFGEIRRA